jgi:hypothetical protein
VTLLDHAERHLEDRGVSSAMIGAGALAIHGVSRSTFDRDLLVSDRRVLDSNFWSDLRAGVSVDSRRGDAADPLAGVVRCHQPGERDVDIVVIHAPWVDAVLMRAVSRETGGAAGRVVTAADLILLKLYAAGSQDRWDIEQLLALDSSGTVRRDVDQRITGLPVRCRPLWAELRDKS